MKKLRNLNAVWLAFAISLPCTGIHLALGAEAAKILSIHQVPSPVKKTIEDQAAGLKLGNIEREQDNGEVTYSVTVTKNGDERDFTVAEDGGLLAVEVTLDEVPPAVQTAIKSQIGPGELDSLHKSFEEGGLNYEVDFTRKDGVERFFSLTPEGKLATIQMSLEEIPTAVRKTIEANRGNGKPGNIYRMTEKSEVSYDAEVIFEDKTRDLMVAENGKLQSIQVFFSETPSPVQATIKEKLGDGKLVRIDRSYEANRGVLPYEVEARKDGKPFNFSVGPRGRFMGMDD